MKEPRIMIRGIDRTDDYRIICPQCQRDMGGTVAARPGHKVHYITCEPCKYESWENFLVQWKERVNADLHDAD